MFSIIPMKISPEMEGSIEARNTIINLDCLPDHNEEKEYIPGLDILVASPDYKKLYRRLRWLGSIEKSKDLVPWQWYCLMGEPKIIQHAIRAGIITESTRSCLEANPLHYVVFSGSPHAIKYLLEAFPKIDPLAVDANGATLLHYAVASESPEVVAYLYFCKLGLDPRKCNSSRQSALDYARELSRQEGSLEMARTFMQENLHLYPLPNRLDGALAHPKKGMEIYTLLFYMDPSSPSAASKILNTAFFFCLGFIIPNLILTCLLGLGLISMGSLILHVGLLWMVSFMSGVVTVLIAATAICVKNNRLGCFDFSFKLFNYKDTLPPLPKVAVESAGATMSP